MGVLIPHPCFPGNREAVIREPSRHISAAKASDRPKPPGPPGRDRPCVAPDQDRDGLDARWASWGRVRDGGRGRKEVAEIAHLSTAYRRRYLVPFVMPLYRYFIWWI